MPSIKGVPRPSTTSLAVAIYFKNIVIGKQAYTVSHQCEGKLPPNGSQFM